MAGHRGVSRAARLSKQLIGVPERVRRVRHGATALCYSYRTLDDEDDTDPDGGFTTAVQVEYTVTADGESIRTGLDFSIDVDALTNGATEANYAGSFTFVIFCRYRD